MGKRGTRALTSVIGINFCPKSKRSQVTIFIIIAVIIVVVISAFFILRSGLLKNVFLSESERVKVFVESCIEETGNEGVYEIGQKGGYFSTPNFSTALEIPYYYSNNKSYMPSEEEIEIEISNYVNENLPFCVKNFLDFPGFEITQREIKTQTKIEEDKIILNVEYPLSVTKGEDTTIFEDFKNIKIPVRLGIIYNAVEEIIDEQLTRESESVCLNCILNISVKNDLYVDMLDYGGGEIVFIVKDETSKINNKVFEFIFANKYGVGE